MLNKGLCNTTLLNDIPMPSTGGLPDESIRFEDLGLQNAQIKLNTPIYDRAPSRLFETERRPNRHGRLVLSDYWDVNDIVLRGTLITDSQTELDTLIDTMKKTLKIQEGNLDILRGDASRRRFKATCVEMDFQRTENFHITWCPIELRFQCLTPFGIDTNYTSNLHSISNLNFSESQTNIGTAEAKPQFILIVTSATDVTSINLKNDTTDQEIEFTTSLSDGDVIIIDSENLTVLKNSVPLDFDGDFPVIEVGVNSFSITVTGTAIEYALTVAHLNSYL